MNPIVLEMLGVAIRWALSSVGGYLVARHVLTADQSERFSTAILEHAVLWAPGAAALAWGVWVRYKGRIKFLTALEARPGTSEASVNATIKRGMGASL